MPTMTRTMTLMKKSTKSTKITKNLQLQRVEKTLVIVFQAIHDRVGRIYMQCRIQWSREQLQFLVGRIYWMQCRMSDVGCRMSAPMVN